MKLYVGLLLVFSSFFSLFASDFFMEIEDDLLKLEMHTINLSDNLQKREAQLRNLEKLLNEMDLELTSLRSSYEERGILLNRSEESNEMMRILLRASWEASEASEKRLRFYRNTLIVLGSILIIDTALDFANIDILNIEGL